MLKKITGKVVNVSNSTALKRGGRVRCDYFLVTVEGTKHTFTVNLSSSTIGLTGSGKGKVFVKDKVKGILIPHQMVTPARLMNQKVEIVGDLNSNEEGYYMNYVSQVVVL